MTEEGLFNESPLFTCTLAFSNRTCHEIALYDTGAGCFSLIDADYVKDHAIPTFPLKNPRGIKAFDGRLILNAINKAIRLTSFTLKDVKSRYVEYDMILLVTKLSKYPISLGIKWAKFHGVSYHAKDSSVTFHSNYCQDYCQVPKLPIYAQAQDLPIISYYGPSEEDSIRRPKDKMSFRLERPKTTIRELRSILKTPGTKSSNN